MVGFLFLLPETDYIPAAAFPCNLVNGQQHRICFVIGLFA
jgi:hypothetical protein